MKKIYVSPEMECVNVQLENVIAASLTSLDKDGGSVDIFDTVLGKEEEAESRRGSIWDDEDY